MKRSNWELVIGIGNIGGIGNIRFARARLGRQNAFAPARGLVWPFFDSPCPAFRRHAGRDLSSCCPWVLSSTGRAPGQAAPQSGQGRQDDGTTRRQDRPRPPSGRGGRFLVVPSARRPVVLAITQRRGEGGDAEPFSHAEFAPPPPSVAWARPFVLPSFRRPAALRGKPPPQSGRTSNLQHRKLIP